MFRLNLFSSCFAARYIYSCLTYRCLLFEPTVLSQNGHDKTEHTLTAQNERTHFSSMGDTVHAHAPRYRTGLSAFTRQGGKCRNCTGIGIYLKRHGSCSCTPLQEQGFLPTIGRAGGIKIFMSQLSWLGAGANCNCT